MYDRKSFMKTLEAVQDYMSLDENAVKGRDHKQPRKDGERVPPKAQAYRDRIAKITGTDKKEKKESVKNVDENIISRMLPGAHGRYMKKLKVAHDHHKNMEQGHVSLETKIDPSKGGDDKKNTDPDRQYEHGRATQDHGRASEAIKKLATHAKSNKLTGHPKTGAGKELHKSAQDASRSAHFDSNNAIKYDEKHHASSGSHPHMDHVKKLKKALGKYHNDTGGNDHHKALD